MPADNNEDAHVRWIEDTKREHAKRAHDRFDAITDQFNAAAVNAGNIALRTAVLVNGGAAIAVLSFIGGLISQGKVGLGELGPTANSLSWFAGGVAAATIGMGFGYFVNYTSGAMVSSHVKTWEHPYTVPGKGTKFWKVLTAIFQICAVTGGLAAVGLFVWGMIEVRQAVIDIGVV